MKCRRSISATVLVLMLLTGCRSARPKATPERTLDPERERAGLLRPGPEPRAWSAEEIDDRGLEDWLNALEAHVQFFAADPEPLRFLEVGARSITRGEYVRALQEFLHAVAPLRQVPALTPALREAFLTELRARFIPHEVFGAREWGEAFATSYYEESLEASHKRTKRFSVALYRKPDDLLKIDTEDFNPEFKLGRAGRARVDRAKGAVLPYYTRAEIDEKGALRGRGLEIAYVDPVDAFFLHVQGSGELHFPDGSTQRVNYAEKNGHPYVSLGKALKARFNDPARVVDLQVLENTLRAMPEPERLAFMSENPSYVFFQTARESSRTYSGIGAIDGRTIATDPQFFPKGLVGYLELTAADVPPVHRFVLDHDIGGAIRGPGRLDLFWGRGKEAKAAAGHVQHYGRYWVLVPRP